MQQTSIKRAFGRIAAQSLLLVALLLAGGAGAQPLVDEPSQGPVRREILAVYDSREEATPEQTRIHRFTEMPLNHLGFTLTYWDSSALISSPR